MGKIKSKANGNSFYEVLLDSKECIEKQDGRKMSAEEFGLLQAVYSKLWDIEPASEHGNV